MPKYVVSTTLDRLEWNNSTLITGDVADKTMLKPVAATTFDSGVAVHTYHPVRDS